MHEISVENVSVHFLYVYTYNEWGEALVYDVVVGVASAFCCCCCCCCAFIVLHAIWFLMLCSFVFVVSTDHVLCEVHALNNVIDHFFGCLPYSVFCPYFLFFWCFYSLFPFHAPDFLPLLLFFFSFTIEFYCVCVSLSLYILYTSHAFFMCAPICGIVFTRNAIAFALYHIEVITNRKFLMYRIFGSRITFTSS